MPKEGLVPTEEVAVKIAEAILFPIYGPELIRQQKPYNIELMDGVWTLKGTFHRPKNGGPVTGGVFTIKISKMNGEILYVIHGE